jgi:hypothetical protein
MTVQKYLTSLVIILSLIFVVYAYAQSGEIFRESFEDNAQNWQ